MGRLAGHLTYLVGPIDECPQYGRDWRKMMTEFYHSLGIGVIDPCDKPSTLYTEDPDFVEVVRKLKEEGKYDEASAMVKPVVWTDLTAVDLSSFITMFIDKDIHMCGSYNEQTYACLERKPVVVCCKQGKAAVPSWLYGIAKHEIFFASWDEVKTYVKHINDDPIEEIDLLKGRWKFFDFDKIFGRTETCRLIP